MDVWGPDRVDDLAGLVAHAMPAEGLTHDELLACCWDDPGVVLGPADGSGAVAATVRAAGEGPPTGFVKLVAVEPVAQGLGLGRRLLAAAHEWFADTHSARDVRVGGSAPFYLWPGVDVRATKALCLFESAGYARVGAEVNMSCPSTFRSPPPDGDSVDRVLGDGPADALRSFVAEQWPWWEAETVRAIEHGAGWGAFAADDGEVAGFACHSVNRAGWLGPMGADPTRRHRGVGRALLGAVCQDLAVAGFADVEIAWVGPIGFYARTAGAAVSRTFVTMRARRGDATTSA